MYTILHIIILFVILNQYYYNINILKYTIIHLQLLYFFKNSSLAIYFTTLK